MNNMIGRRVTSRWDTGKDGDARQGVIIAYWAEPPATVIVKWDDGEEMVDNKTSMIIHKRRER